VQQVEHVKWPLLVCLTSKILLGIIGILTWGVGFIPQSAWAHLEKDRNLVHTFKQAKLPMQSLWKLHGLLGIRHWSPINTIKPKKWMQYPSITIPKSFMGGIFPYLYSFFVNIVYILKVESNFYFIFYVFFFFFCVRLRGTTKEAFVAYAI
jgi:hypothetical protein